MNENCTNDPIIIENFLTHQYFNVCRWRDNVDFLVLLELKNWGYLLHDIRLAGDIHFSWFGWPYYYLLWLGLMIKERGYTPHI